MSELKGNPVAVGGRKMHKDDAPFTNRAEGKGDGQESPDSGANSDLSLVHLLAGVSRDRQTFFPRTFSTTPEETKRLELPVLHISQGVWTTDRQSEVKSLRGVPIRADELAACVLKDFRKTPEHFSAENGKSFSFDVFSTTARRAGGRAKDYSVPPEMKYGAAFNAWDRVGTDTQSALVRKIKDLSRELLSHSASINNTERTGHGFLIKRDAEGRVVSLEKPGKNIRMHFKYEGKSDNVIGMVVENTKTNDTKAFLAVHTSKGESIGSRQWIAVDSKGNRDHLSGEISVGKRGGHSVRLDSLSKVLETIEKKIAAERPKDEVTRERERLERVAEKRFTKSSELEEYKTGLEKFQKEAQAKGLSKKEVVAFFKESARLLEPTNARLSEQNRSRVALEALKQAIDPTSVRQGNFSTCNVASIEVCMYSRNPSKVMKAVTDVALTGKFKTADGREIELPKSTLDTNPQRRTLASQIFQSLAVNVVWKDRVNGPNGKRGDITYDHLGAKATDNDTGQRVTIRDSRGSRVLHKSPGLDSYDYPEIYRRIAGERPETLSIRFGTGKSPVDGVATIASKQAFHNKLVELSKQPGGFPVTLRVHTSNKPFWEDSGAGKEPGAGVRLEAKKAGEREDKESKKNLGGWHSVTIHGYDPKTGEVKVDNQWGRSLDHMTKGVDKGPIKIDDLFNAMEIHKDRQKELKAMIQAAAPRPRAR